MKLNWIANLTAVKNRRCENATRMRGAAVSEKGLLAWRLVPGGLGVVEALGPLVVHVAHELADGAQRDLALVGLEQRERLLGWRGEPRVHRVHRQDHRHAVVDARDGLVRVGGDDGEGLHRLAL